MKRCFWMAPLLLAAAVPATAQTGSGFARSGAILRAGPAAEYPRVATVVGGDSLTVYGCVGEWSWCDVRWREARGWLPAGVVEFNTRDGGVAPSAGLGVPAITFAVDRYWDEHYRGRPWARDRTRWRQQPAVPQSASSPTPEALRRQFAPQQAAESRRPEPESYAVAQPVQQWIPPGERMYQAPPPDALNPKRNKELAERQRRDEDDRRWRESVHASTASPPSSSSASPWWPPKPETVVQAAQHTPPPAPPPKPASPPPAPPPSAPPPRKERTEEDDEGKRRVGKQLER